MSDFRLLSNYPSIHIENIMAISRVVHNKIKIMVILLLFLLSWVPLQYTLSYADTSSWESLFQDNFESGDDQWELQGSFEVVTDNGNQILRSTDEGGASLSAEVGRTWTDYRFRCKVRLQEGGIHIIARAAHYLKREGFCFYHFFPGEHELEFARNIGPDFEIIQSIPTAFEINRWYQVEFECIGPVIKVFVDGAEVLSYTDTDPLLFGSIGFFGLPNSTVDIDDVGVQGQSPTKDFTWERTGGPSGGLGYDIRIHPLDPQVMFVTDNPSGINKSYDGGNTWIQRNSGINVRTGASFDAIPIFSLTIDPLNPNIVWAGMQNYPAIYKSLDNGETWAKKVNGIEEDTEISFRGFGIHPTNSDIVFAAAEISTNVMGKTFGKTKGVIYKSENGGDNWQPVWRGDNLARFVLFDYQNPIIMYASTGIWDREAFNDTGVGVLKSTDGGESWTPMNTGLESLYVGFLEMHPTNPQIIYAAAGENAYFLNCGVYKTTNGGQSWQKILGEGTPLLNREYPAGSASYTIVTLSPSNPNYVYASDGVSFYRSEDGGVTWRGYNQGYGWGPPGVVAGQPISAVVSPNDPLIVFANNYTGGSFKSTDGGETWENASTDYTGVELFSVKVDRNNPHVAYAFGRSGPFKSHDYGDTWNGIAYDPARAVDVIGAINPENSNEIITADRMVGIFYKSSDGGTTWRKITNGLVDPDICVLNENTCFGFSEITYAPSNTQIIYAGSRGFKYENYILPSPGMYKSVDGGETWNQISTNLDTPAMNIHCIAVDQNDPDVVYIGTWQDGIFKTTDGGNSWNAVNTGLTSSDVRSLAIDPNDSDLIYAGLGDGAGIAKSINGGLNWMEINQGVHINCPSYLQRAGETKQGLSFESQPKFTILNYDAVPWTIVTSIAINTTDPLIIYAGDLQRGAYRSLDRGKNWEPVTNGLSFKAITDLDISADGTILYAATGGGGVFRWSSNPNLVVPDEPSSPDDDNGGGGGGGGGCFITDVSP